MFKFEFDLEIWGLGFEVLGLVFFFFLLECTQMGN